MGEQKFNKLNWLSRNLPEGLLADAAWLEEKGYYGSLRKKYVDAGWLEQPARGVYRRPRGSLSWDQVVVSLQSVMAFPVAVGGRTALELLGFAHYLTTSQREAHLYCDRTLPGWVAKLPLETAFIAHNRKRLFPDLEQKWPIPFAEHSGKVDATVLRQSHVQLLQQGPCASPVVISTPERAVLELLDELPRRETFDQVDALFDGMATLRPGHLHELLIHCRSIKVKRLFLFFAERHDHDWFAHVDQSCVDLGKGKRMLVKGGRLDSQYLITVPKAF